LLPKNLSDTAAVIHYEEALYIKCMHLTLPYLT